MESKSCTTASLQRSTWIRSLSWDTIWILSGVPAGLVLYFISRLPDSVAVMSFILTALWGGHLIAPGFLAWAHEGYRERIFKEKQKFVFVPLAIVLLFTLLGVAAAFGYTSIPAGDSLHALAPDVKDSFNAMIFFFWLYTFWNGYHFAAQVFGIQSIYRIKCGGYGPKQRDLDRVFCFLNYLVLVPLGWYITRLDSIRGVLLFLPEGSPRIVSVLQDTCICFSILCALVMLALEFKKREPACIQRILNILTICAGSVSIYFSVYIYLGITVISHYLAAMALSASVVSNHKRRVGRRLWTNSTACYLVVLILLSVPIGVLVEREVYLERITNFYTILDAAPRLLMGLVGFRFGLAIVHFLYDRYVYKFSSPGIRAIVTEDLLT